MNNITNLPIQEDLVSPELSDEETTREILTFLVGKAEQFLKLSDEEFQKFQKEKESGQQDFSTSSIRSDAWVFQDIRTFELPILRSAVNHTKDYLHGQRIIVYDTNPGPQYLIELVLKSCKTDQTLSVPDPKLMNFLTQLEKTRDYLDKHPGINKLKPYKH